MNMSLVLHNRTTITNIIAATAPEMLQWYCCSCSVDTICCCATCRRHHHHSYEAATAAIDDATAASDTATALFKWFGSPLLSSYYRCHRWCHNPSINTLDLRSKTGSTVAIEFNSFLFAMVIIIRYCHCYGAHWLWCYDVDGDIDIY